MQSKFLISTIIGKHSKPVHTIASSHALDKDYLVTGSVDRKVRFLDSKNGSEIVQRSGHTRSVMAVSISEMGPNGEDPLICSGGREGCLIMWEPSMKFSGHIVRVPLEEIRCVSVYQGSESFVLVGSKDGKLVLWDLNNDFVVAEFEGTKGCIHCVSIHSFASDPETQHDLDYMCIASGGADRAVRLWDMKNPTARRKKLKHSRSVGCIAVACKGIRPVLASGTSDNYITLWDVQSGLQLQVLEGHKGPINQIQFWEGYEILLVSASADRTLRVFDALTGESVCTLIGHTDDVLDLTITADFKPSIVSCGIDNTIRFWDLEGIINTYFRSPDSVLGSRNSVASYNPRVEYTPPKSREEAVALHERRKQARREQRKQLKMERRIKKLEEEERNRALLEAGLAHSLSAQKLQLALSSRNKKRQDSFELSDDEDDDEDEDLEAHFQKINKKKNTIIEQQQSAEVTRPGLERKKSVHEQRKSVDKVSAAPMGLEDQINALLNDNFDFDDDEDVIAGEQEPEMEDEDFDGEMLNQMMALRSPEKADAPSSSSTAAGKPSASGGLSGLFSNNAQSVGKVHPVDGSPEITKTGSNSNMNASKPVGIFGVMAASKFLQRLGIGRRNSTAVVVPELENISNSAVVDNSANNVVNTEDSTSSPVGADASTDVSTSVAITDSQHHDGGKTGKPKRPSLKRGDSHFKRADEITSEFNKAEASKKQMANQQKSKAQDRLAQRLKKKQNKDGGDGEEINKNGDGSADAAAKEQAALQALKAEKLLQHKLQEERMRKAMQQAQNRSVQALQRRLEEIAAKRAAEQLPVEDGDHSDEEDQKTIPVPERDVFFISDDEEEEDD